jgi:pheromone shutdown protein TraB
MQSYEFSESQNGLIKDLSQKMRFVGYFSIGVGVLSILGGLFALATGGSSSIISGILAIVVGLWTLSAGNAFQRIVATQGSDIENLMGALGELRKLYTLQFWALILALVFTAIGLIVAIASRGFG